MKLLIANRGEIAVRIARTAAEMGVTTVAIHPADDAASLHLREADETQMLPGAGAAAYLDIAAVIAAARATAADAVHPGYGFLAENAAFARACAEVGLAFVGPDPDTLDLFGDKASARAHAEACGVPIIPGTAATSRDEARAFAARHGPVMLKAVGGGGGRGMRAVERPDALDAAWARAAGEALAAFGDDRLYVERFLPRARHVEVQVIGDGTGAVLALGDRECSVQRRHQKLIEWAPALGLPDATRAALADAAVRLAAAARLKSLATVEFLLAADDLADWAFIEANPRIQVEHTVTEEVTGLDLVRLQLRLARGEPLAALGLTAVKPRGVALQARVNLETIAPDGAVRPAAGTLARYAEPGGRGVRVDGFGYEGYTTSLRYDPLLAKVIVQVDAGGLAAAAAKADRTLARFRIEGAPTNLGVLRAILTDPAFAAGEVDVRWVDANAAALAERGAALLPFTPGAVAEQGGDSASPVPSDATGDVEVPLGAVPVAAPMPGTLVSLAVAAGERVAAGQEVAIVEAMKMQHGVVAPIAGLVVALAAATGGTVNDGQPLLFIEPQGEATVVASDAAIDPAHIRPDLAELRARRATTLDGGRPDAVARRRRTGQRTARENIADLVDPGSFTEYGGLTIAGRSRRATADELIAQSPADGLVMGLATVNAGRFGPERARVAAMAYDYTVFAGTQGARNHIKTDRLVELADRWRLPLVMFAEGGGGRPGDTDGGGFIRAFELLPKLSGRVPIVGIVSGRCFAGNASFLGMSDVIIATRDVTLGMGGPAMIEGGGLGVFTPEEVGPVAVHVAGGVIDLLVDDEAAAVAAAKRYLAYFQGPLPDWTCADQRRLRHLVPENRLRVYDVRAVIAGLADEGTVLELRRGFGLAMVTALVRIEGRAMGLIANDPAHLGGAIDADAADKAARFLQLCEAHDLPVLSLSDTPGIMVGPEVEKTGLVRHAARLFVIGANLTVPLLSVVLRKSYGLGAIAMTGGSYQASLFSIAWPTGEFGGMGLEGAVRLGYRRELDAIADPAERQARFTELVAQLYQHGKALSTAGYFGIDDVIDPADTRAWIAAALRSVPPSPPSEGKRLRWIDPW